MKVNVDTISALVERNKNDKELLDFIYGILMDFEAYHRAVFEMECKAMLFNRGALAHEEYQDMITTADKSRTTAHNNLLGMVNALNRLAAQNGLLPFYDGTVSEERPYRREVATAVFDYIQSIIESR